MLAADDSVLGPCPLRCGGVVILLGPTIKAERAANFAASGVPVPADEDAPRCELATCNYQAASPAVYEAEMQDWRQRVMGAIR